MWGSSGGFDYKKIWEKWEFFSWLEVEERFRAEGDIQEQRR